MIRKTVIVILSTLAAATLVVATLSFLTPLWWDSTPTGSDWCALNIGDGRLTLYAVDKQKLQLAIASHGFDALSERSRLTGDGTFDRAFEEVFASLTQSYKENGLPLHWWEPTAVFFDSWRDWGIWGLTCKVRARWRTVIVVPLWMPMLVFTTYPAITLIRGPFRRYRRRKCNQCVHCSYNLTGNVSGICPECGAPTVDRSSSDLD